MKWHMMKRLYLGILAVAAIAALTTVGSMALFSAVPANLNPTGDPEGNYNTATYTTGTVSLGNPTTRLASVSGIAPGDFDSKTYTIKYTGSLDAWMGLQTSLTGALIADCSQFTVTVSDADGNTYNPDSAHDADTTKRTLVVRSGAPDAAHPDANLVPVVTDATKAFTVAWSLSSNAGAFGSTACQGKSATITLTVSAVQSKNNTNAGNTGPGLWQ